MFDVHWDDEALESIGHKKARGPAKKGRERNNESNNLRSSVSSRSSLASREKPSSFLGSFGLKISNSRRGSSKLSPSAAGNSSRTTSLCSQPDVPLPGIGRTLECAIPNDTSIHIGLTPTSCEFYQAAVPSASPSLVPSEENSTKRSSKDTTLSELTEATAPASPPPPLSKPIVTEPERKRPQPIEGIPDSTPHAAVIITEAVPISKDAGEDHEDSAVSRSPAGQTANLSGSASTSTVIYNWFAAVHDPTELSPAEVPDVSKRCRAIPLPANLKPPTSKGPIPGPSLPPATRRNLAANPKKLTRAPKASDPNAWKSPAEWESMSRSKLPTFVSHELHLNKDAGQSSPDSLALDLSAMKREIARMAAASARLVIARMSEDWGAPDLGAFYKELEMERKRWMLSALDGINKQAINPKMSEEPTADQHLLALFETQATASYLAGVYHSATITHLAPDPLSRTLFPNVSPLPSPITASLSVPRNRYNEVRCLSLPSILPSSDIPTILRRIHRCLAPTGVLRLVLVDPLPTRESLGPYMRDWLDDNLLINLESQFRCTSPNRLFPLWLAKAGLRGDGSLVTKLKFNAVHQPGHGEEKGNTGCENDVKDELRTITGRKLWQEVWGSFALGQAWWWDDPACVEECARLGTHFEYSVIEAVKEEAA